MAIAERFAAAAALHALVLPGDAFAAFRGGACRVWIVAEAWDDWRVGTLQVGGAAIPEVPLAFPAFDNPDGAVFHLLVTGAGGVG